MKQSYPLSLSSIGIIPLASGCSNPEASDFTESFDLSDEIAVSDPAGCLAVRLDFVRTGKAPRANAVRCRLALSVKDHRNFRVSLVRFSIHIDAGRESASTIQYIALGDLPRTTGTYILTVECDGGFTPLFNRTFTLTQSEEPDDWDTMIRDFINSCKEEARTAPVSGKKLERMTGLDNVKRKIASYKAVTSLDNRRQTYGLKSLRQPLHSMFLGSPGTGKTTVAKCMGQILHEAGALSRGHVVVRERASLMGTFYGSQEEKTLAALKEARGGILFIDEAYQLYTPEDPRDPARLVIETLLTALADEDQRDWMLILAGYTAPMKRMFEMNPGFRSRIPESNIFVFEDYTVEQLMEIAMNYLSDNAFSLTMEAEEKLRTRLSHDWLHRDSSFGNARHVVTLIQTEVIPAMALRLAERKWLSEQELRTIEAADIPGIVKAERKIDHPRVGFRA